MTLFLALSSVAVALETNTARFTDAPPWVTAARVDKAVAKVERYLEWDIRKIHVRFYTSAAEFQKAHGLGPGVLAATFKSRNEVLMGPNVVDADFDSVFAHELVHIVLGQKYKKAIPDWLEEGLANHVAERGKVDYPKLQGDLAAHFTSVEKLAHPFSGKNPRFAYQASTALMEFIRSKCDAEDLINMSAGKDLRVYLRTMCEITEVNTEFKHWVARKAKS